MTKALRKGATHLCILCALMLQEHYGQLFRALRFEIWQNGQQTDSTRQEIVATWVVRTVNLSVNHVEPSMEST